MNKVTSNDDHYDDVEEEIEEEEEEEQYSFHPICAQEKTFSTLHEAVEYDLMKHRFDLLSMLHDTQLALVCGWKQEDDNGCGDDDGDDEGDDMFYRSVQCINFCRGRVATYHNSGANDGGDIGAYLTAQYRQFIEDQKEAASAGGGDAEDGAYFRPALEDDAYLLHLDDLLSLMLRRYAEDDSTTSACSGNESASRDRLLGTSDLKARDRGEDHATYEGSSSSMRSMQMQIASLQEQLDMARSCIASLTSTADSDESAALAVRRRGKRHVDNDTYYFDGYSHYAIHETMLRDTVRTGSYERAILGNADALFKGKVVLDVGCGTGILSIFAARAGAKKVVAVDNSADILHLAKKIADGSGYADVVTFCKGKMEDMVANTVANNDDGYDDGSCTDSSPLPRLPLDVGEVDVIVSEWMGYALFFETMLPSVMSARDVFLKKDASGAMFPNAARVYIEGATDASLEFWSDVHGVDMSVLRDKIALDLTTEAGVEVVPATDIVTDRCELIGFDLNTCRDADLDFAVPFRLLPKFADEEQKHIADEDKPSSETTPKGRKIDKLVISFDIDFTHNCTSPVSFSTGCQSTPTHWKQCVLWIDPIVAPALAREEVLRGTFNMRRNAVNHREIDFHVLWEVVGFDEGEGGKVRSDGSIKSKLSA